MCPPWSLGAHTGAPLQKALIVDPAGHTRTAEDNMAEEDRKDFFISYTKADKAWAEWIAWELENEGYTCVLQA